MRLQRFQQRAESSERHPGHGDQGNYAEFTTVSNPGGAAPLEIGGELIEVHTTNFLLVDYRGIIIALRAAIAKDCEIETLIKKTN